MARSPYRHRPFSRFSYPAASRFKLPWGSPLSLAKSAIAKSARSKPEDNSDPENDSELENSRLKRRLQEHVVRHRPRLSRLVRRLEAKKSKRRFWQRAAAVSVLSVAMGGGIWGNLFVQEKVTLGGVPYGIIHKFWHDPAARTAYFVGDSSGLHNRLRSLGIEADIKDYYRDRFATEHELDRHIHQIMYDRTGYVGEAYRVSPSGQLVSIKSSRL
ncbi:MAG: hypothetical protein AAFY33_20815 [Cyanobacteria bacterium J06643_4]